MFLMKMQLRINEIINELNQESENVGLGRNVEKTIVMFNKVAPAEEENFMVTADSCEWNEIFL